MYIDCSDIDPCDWDERDAYLADMADRERDERKLEAYDGLTWEERMAREVL